jgi:hypothetical protein
VIAFAHTVLAAISVKTTMEAATLKDTIDGLQTVRRVVRDAALNAETVWCGGFFYQVDERWMKNIRLVYKHARSCVLSNLALPPIVDDDRPHIFGPNFIGDSSEIALIFDYERQGAISAANVRGYSCDGTATAVFLSCLLEHITINLGGTHSAFTDLVVDLAIPTLTPPGFTIPGGKV